MRTLIALAAAIALFEMPHAAHAPGARWRSNESASQQVVPDADTTASLLRRVGDHTARLAFIADPRVRRRGAAWLAQEFHAVAAGTSDMHASTVIRRLANALAHYDLLQIAAASEQRRVLEGKHRHAASAQSHSGANVP